MSYNVDSNIIVSLTSFPARISRVWVAIESLLQQDLHPWKVILVLSEEEFPLRHLPKSVNRLKNRGLEILWVSKNIKSYKKLLPVRERYPLATIVTADDDIRYKKGWLRQLVVASQERPLTIVGHRGWEVAATHGDLIPYQKWIPASKNTVSDQCFLTGGGGVLYPPDVLNVDILLDVELALRLCPYADDIWFWAVGRVSGVSYYCLGNHFMQPFGNRFMHPVPSLNYSPALSDQNWGCGQNDVQLDSVIKYFGMQSYVQTLSDNNASL